MFESNIHGRRGKKQLKMKWAGCYWPGYLKQLLVNTSSLKTAVTPLSTLTVFSQGPVRNVLKVAGYLNHFDNFGGDRRERGGGRRLVGSMNVILLIRMKMITIPSNH